MFFSVNELLSRITEFYNGNGAYDKLDSKLDKKLLSL